MRRFTYTPRGQVDLRTEGPSPGSGQAPSSVDYDYDRIGRLKTLTDAFAGGNGNVTQNFTHNPASQIVTRTRSNDTYASNTAYAVDRDYDVNGLNQYTEAGPASFTYDANGNLTSDGSTTYVYDVENRLVSASGAHTAALRYDPLGRLYEVTGTQIRRFLWDGDALVAEYLSNGSLVNRYVHGTSSGDDPLVWYTGGENRRLHADHQGSIVAVTDGAGAIRNINAYDAWGIPNPANVGRFQYTGQLWIGDLGMYHYKARVYSPTLGRFLQVHPVGYDEDLNLYTYLSNDPINDEDPTGACSLCVRVVGEFVIEAGVQYLTTGRVDVPQALRGTAEGLVNPLRNVDRARDVARAIRGADRAADNARTADRGSDIARSSRQSGESGSPGRRGQDFTPATRRAVRGSCVSGAHSSLVCRSTFRRRRRATGETRPGSVGTEASQPLLVPPYPER